MTTASPSRSVRSVLPNVVARLFEVALIVVGLGFILADDDDELGYLAIWDLLALIYVVVGMIVLRRTRKRPPLQAPAAPLQHRFRFNFAFAIVSSVIGFFSAIDIALTDEVDDHTILLNILGAMAMVFSWMLLQAGYARRYAGIYRSGNGGLTFPSTEHPSAVDFLYFSVTIGTAFSASVLVDTSRMRWHVMVHSVVAFFYNAAVVAFALSLIAGR